MSKLKIMLITLVAIGLLSNVYAYAATIKVFDFSGDAKIYATNTNNVSTLTKGMPVSAGSKIITGKDSYVELVFDNEQGNIVKILEKTEVIILLENDEKIQLIDGELYAMLQNLKNDEKFVVRTPSATCGARGTGWTTKYGKDVTETQVFDGVVYVRGINEDGSLMRKEYKVKKGYERITKRFSAPDKMTKIKKERSNIIEKEIKTSNGLKTAFERKTKDNRIFMPGMRKFFNKNKKEPKVSDGGVGLEEDIRGGERGGNYNPKVPSEQGENNDEKKLTENGANKGIDRPIKEPKEREKNMDNKMKKIRRPRPRPPQREIQMDAINVRRDDNYLEEQKLPPPPDDSNNTP